MHKKNRGKVGELVGEMGRKDGVRLAGSWIAYKHPLKLA